MINRIFEYDYLIKLDNEKLLNEAEVDENWKKAGFHNHIVYQEVFNNYYVEEDPGRKEELCNELEALRVQAIIFIDESNKEERK